NYAVAGFTERDIGIHAIDIRGGSHEELGIIAGGNFQNIESALRIVTHSFEPVAVTRNFVGSEVGNQVDAFAHCVQCGRIRDVHDMKTEALILHGLAQVLALALREVVDGDYAMPTRQQSVAKMGTQEPGCTG